jgi:DNA-binding CsgD family transcriptional regulator
MRSAALDPRQRARVRALAKELEVLRVGEGGALSTLARRLTDTLEVPRVTVFAFHERDERVRISEGSVSGIPIPDLLEMIDRFLSEQPPRDFACYDPIRPEPFDRNRVRSRAEACARHGGEPPITRLQAKVGIARDEHVRVVVCDGSSMVGYLGLFQSAPYERWQLAGLQALGAPLRRRLSLERALTDSPRTRGELGVALEALGAPAWIVRAPGVITHANRAGQAALGHDRADVHARVRAAIASRSVTAFEVTAVTGRGEPDAWLVIDRAQTGSLAAHARVRAYAAELALTPRLAQVLELIARGLANRTISAELRISEATVEQYVTALLVRAGVESRAALIARILWS